MNAAEANRDVTPADVDLSRVWLGVAARVWARQPGRLERLAGRLLRSPGLARALLTTPSLLLGWVIATAAVLAAGAAATSWTGTPLPSYWEMSVFQSVDQPRISVALSPPPEMYIQL